MMNTNNQRRNHSSSNNNSNNRQQQNKQSKKRKQDQTNNDNRKRKPSAPEDLDSKIARILGTNNNQQQFASASSSTNLNHSVSGSNEKNKSRHNNNRASQQKSNSISSSSSTSGGNNILPGFYFDSKANRYFPIPKNGLECSLLVGNSEERMIELQTHKMSQLKIKKKIIEVPSTSSIQSGIVKHQASTLLNHNRKNQFYTFIKSRMIHPSDNRLYNKHVVNRMENIKLLNNLSNIEKWKECKEIVKYEDVHSNIQLVNYPIITNRQTEYVRNLSWVKNDTIQTGEYNFQQEENYKKVGEFYFRGGEPIYSYSTLEHFTRKNVRKNRVYMVVTPKQCNYMSIYQMSMDDNEVLFAKNFNISKNKSVFSQSKHPNNRWFAIGLNKGGVIIDLKQLISNSNIKKSTIAYISNQFSDILITYWNPFILEFGELFYARRDGSLFISQLKESTSFKNPTYSQQEICSLQYGTENFIGQILSLDEDRFLVKSVCKNGLSYNTYIHMFDKRKLGLNSSPFKSCLLSYHLEDEQPLNSNLATIMTEVKVKMFIHNSRFLICGDTKGWLRVWDIFKGGKPISTKKLQDNTCCSELLFCSTSFYSSSGTQSSSGTNNVGSIQSSSEQLEGHLMMSLPNANTTIAIPLHR